jgi:hypothetical protein
MGILQELCGIRVTAINNGLRALEKLDQPGSVLPLRDAFQVGADKAAFAYRVAHRAVLSKIVRRDLSLGNSRAG